MKIADVEVGGYVSVPYVTPAGRGTPRIEGRHLVRVIEVRPRGRLLVEEERWKYRQASPSELKAYGGLVNWIMQAPKKIIPDHVRYEVASRSCRPGSRGRVHNAVA